MKHYQNIEKCRICGSEQLTEVIHFAPQHLSPTFVKSNQNNELSEIKVPLTLTLCDRAKNPKGCGLLQLKETVEPDLLYRDYFYRTAVSDTMCQGLKDFVEDLMGHLKLNEGDYVIDIGANDCTMLSYFPASLNRIAVEPAKNIDWSNVDGSIKIVNDYFSKQAVQEAIEGKPVKAITCCAMFYDLEEPNSFVSDIKSILAPDGIWSIQLSYLGLMLKNMNFYDICNEHLEYYSLDTLKNLMERHKLSIFDASTNQVNGGSARVFISHSENNYQPSANLEKLYSEEERMKLYQAETYRNFNGKIMGLKDKVNNFVAQEIDKGKLVLGLGASTKGNILLQLFGITKEILPAISERNPDKVGRRTLGTDIKLISEKEAREMNPSCMLVLPWYFKEEIVKRERAYLEEGGKLLFPMPYPHFVDKKGETNL